MQRLANEQVFDDEYTMLVDGEVSPVFGVQLFTGKAKTPVKSVPIFSFSPAVARL